MNSDNYDFSKSAAPQSVSAYSPYTDKQWDLFKITLVDPIAITLV